MKTTFTFILILNCSLVFTQVTISEVIKTAFGEKCSGARNINWQINHNKYEAEYIISNKFNKSVFDSTGKWLFTATALSTSKLPIHIRDTVKIEFVDAVIERAFIIENNEVTFFQLRIYDINKGNWIVELTKEGRIISRKNNNLTLDFNSPNF